jgi:hypothetical protein
MWGDYPYLARNSEMWRASSYVRNEEDGDPNLRSTRDVAGYHIQATDGAIGHVVDFLIDDDTWAIRYLVVDTHNWLPGKKVLIAPQWIDRVNWSDSTVSVNLSMQSVKDAPEYSDTSEITQSYEAGLYSHYNREGYWVSEKSTKNYLQGLRKSGHDQKDQANNEDQRRRGENHRGIS